jgi:nucleoside-diphosphate-sugar epimerase
VPERVLLTGATGFVGSHIAEALASAGCEVRCAVRNTSDPRWLSGLKVRLVRADFGRPEDLARLAKGADAVVHAAGITRARRPEDFYAVNAGITRRLAAAAARAGARRFVLISSLAARGPDGEDGPVSHYGRSKLQAEQCLREFGELRPVILRPAAVYGPRDRDFLPLFRLARSGWLPVPASANPLQPVYAADVARAVLLALRKDGPGPFPLAEEARYSWREVAEALEAALGRRVRPVRLPTAGFVLAGRAAGLTARLRGAPPAFDERRARDIAVHAWTCDPSAAERALGWRAGVPLPEGLGHTAGWYRREGWL